VPPHRIPPKTRASIREIPLLPQLAAVLRQHKRSTPFTGRLDYVFATAHGTAFLHHNVSKRVLRRAAVDAGLDRPGRRLRFHDLRHTFASHLIIDIRLDVAQVSSILGHARTSMTLDTYTHLFEEHATAATSVPNSRRATSPTCSTSQLGLVYGPASTSAPPAPPPQGGFSTPQNVAVAAHHTAPLRPAAT
jgi:integrase